RVEALESAHLSPRRPWTSLAFTLRSASTPGGAVTYGVVKSSECSRSAVGVSCERARSAPASFPATISANGCWTTFTRSRPRCLASAAASRASKPETGGRPSQNPGAGRKAVATVSTPGFADWKPAPAAPWLPEHADATIAAATSAAAATIFGLIQPASGVQTADTPSQPADCRD